MSILEFPPLGGKDQPYALYEMNGRIVYGSIEEVEAVSTSDMVMPRSFFDISLASAKLFR